VTALERRHAVGDLLRDQNLTFVQIAKLIHVTPANVGRIQRVYYPDLPRAGNLTNRMNAEQSALVRQLVGNPDITLDQIAQQAGITRERVRQIEHKLLPDFKRPKGIRPWKPRPAVPANGIRSVTSLKQELLAHLRSIDHSWCPKCYQAKPLADFHPRVRAGYNGYWCRACSTARTVEGYHRNPNVRDYYARYRQEHSDQQLRTAKKGNLKRQLTDWLERNAPKHAEAVRDGQMTLEEAAARCGKKIPTVATVIVETGSVSGFLRAIRRTLAPEDQWRLAASLMQTYLKSPAKAEAS